MAKTSPDDFKVTTLEISLLSQQAVTSKGITVSYTNLQLNHYFNTQLNLFCGDNFFFWCTSPSMRLQSLTREGCRLQSSSIHLNDKDPKVAWSQNPTVHKHSNFFIRTMNYDKFCLRSQFAQQTLLEQTLLKQTLLNTCTTCEHFDGPENNPFICLGLWEKKVQTHNHEFESKQN